MRLLEATGSMAWPVGGSAMACNYPYMFPWIVAKGIKNLELTLNEYACFFQGYSKELANNSDVVTGKFTLAGVEIKII